MHVVLPSTIVLINLSHLYKVLIVILMSYSSLSPEVYLLVLVFVRKDLKHRFIVSKDDDGFFFVLIEISLCTNNILRISSYYRPPYDANFSNFLSHMEWLLSKYSRSALILVGDMNVKICRNNQAGPNSIQYRYGTQICWHPLIYAYYKPFHHQTG